MSDDAKNMPQMYHRAALQAGFAEIIPIIPPGAPLHEHSRVDPEARGKVPGDYYGGAWDGMGNWPEYEMTPERAERWDSLRANVGLKMGRQWTGLDVDVTDDLLAAEMRRYMDGTSGGTWPIRVGLAPKALWLFRVTGDPIKRKQYPFKREGADRQLIEVLGLSSKGRPTQAVIFGSHPSGSEYEWNMPLSLDAIPVIDQAGMDGLVQALSDVAKSRGWEPGRAVIGNPSDGTGSDLGAEPVDQSLVPEVVALIPNEDREYDDWVAIGYAIKGAMGAVGWETWCHFSNKAQKVNPHMTKRAWDSFKPDGSTGMGKLVFLARQACGGMLPGDLDSRIRAGAALKGAMNAGMPMTAPAVMQGVDTSHTPPDTPVADDWIDLVANDDGKAYANAANVQAYLNNSDLWRGCFAYDAFNGRAVILRPMPEAKDLRVPRWVEDDDYEHAYHWFQRHMWPKLPKGEVLSAITVEAKRSSFEPVQNYLMGLTWDGTPRLDNWLFKYAGVEAGVDPTSLHYVQQIGRKWLVSAVARAMQPGCQADHVLILEGTQGKGKSTLFRALCPNEDWFSDSLPDFHTKDASEHLEGKWLTEMSELTTVLKADIEDMRRFITRRVEQFRPSYGRNQVTRPRRVVFCGSTNRDDYLKDTQGERRFWIARCTGELQIDWIRQDRDQLWAEAYAAYMAGEVWYLDKATEGYAHSVQVSRVATDPWIDVIQQAVVHLPEVSIGQVMLLMGMDLNMRSKIAQSRVRQCLEQLGYERDGYFINGRPKFKKDVQ